MSLEHFALVAGVVIASLGLIGGLIAWAVRRIDKHMDDVAVTSVEALRREFSDDLAAHDARLAVIEAQLGNGLSSRMVKVEKHVIDIKTGMGEMKGRFDTFFDTWMSERRS